jgi:hypothetical protein
VQRLWSADRGDRRRGGKPGRGAQGKAPLVAAVDGAPPPGQTEWFNLWLGDPNRVVAKERITVPAGAFEAFHIEGVGWSQSDKYGVNVYNRFRISPAVRPCITHESRTRFASGKLSNHERCELTGCAQR